MERIYYLFPKPEQMDALLIIGGAVIAIVILIVLLSSAKRKAALMEQMLLLKESELTTEKGKVLKTQREKDDTIAAYNRMADELTATHKQEIQSMQNAMAETEKKYAPLLHDDKEITKRKDSLKELQFEIETLKSNYSTALGTYKQLEKQIDLYKETLELNEYGVYQPKYSFDLPEQYQLELGAIYNKQKAMVQKGEAAICTTEWTVGGSVVEGRKMTRQFIKLVLYAFNGECDAMISKVKWNNVNKYIERMRKSFEDINKLGVAQYVHITEDYLQLKLAELSLSYEYEQKKFDEKEEQRRIREQMREEERAQKEFEKAQRDAEEEEKRYQKALEKAKKDVGLADPGELDALNEKIKILEANLQEAQEKKERALSLAQTTKVGHIYIISNIGSFGEGIYKIGMTRRLDPLDRVKELGDASVPFQFDVHAIIYSDNAPQLEYELHKKFDTKRINRINGRKEFFKATLDEIESFIKEHTNAEIQFTKLAEAKEYRETLNLIQQLGQTVELKKESPFPENLFE